MIKYILPQVNHLFLSTQKQITLKPENATQEEWEKIKKIQHKISDLFNEIMCN